jgi:hypothetical protein
MADERLTDRTTLSELADGDLIHVVDISDTTDNPLGTSKKGLWSLFKSTLLTYFNTQYLRSVTGDSVNNTDPLNPVVNAIPLSGTTVGNPVTGDIELNNNVKIILNDVSGDIGFIQGRNDGEIEIGQDAYGVLISADTGLIVDHGVRTNNITNSNVSGGMSLLDINGVGLTGVSYYGANYTDNTYVQKKYVDDKYNVSGTTNYISKFTGSNSIGNSQIYDNGTNVGIGTASPSYKLHVSGTGRFTGTTLFQSQLTVAESFGDSVLEVGNSGMGGNHRINIIPAGSGQDAGYYISGTPRVYTNTGNTSITRINAPSTGIIQFETNLTERVRINNSGNVGIGTTNPTAKLHVVGLPNYADNATALAGGLTVGAFYHTAGVLKVVI